MKKYSITFLLTSVLTASSLAGEQPQLVDETAKINYSVGYQIGSDFKYQDIEIRPEAVLQGIEDALRANQSQMTAAEMKQVMVDLGKRLAEKKREQRKVRLEQLQQQSEDFHKENRKKHGVVTTESGLQYRILEKGHGKQPAADDTVLVHYAGKLINGTLFDSSLSRGKPASFRVDKVIKGWSEALQMMKTGDRWQLYIPPELGYGEKGTPPKIPPYSTLIFDVELISIEK